jgi:hypothetical protein
MSVPPRSLVRTIAGLLAELAFVALLAAAGLLVCFLFSLG